MPCSGPPEPWAGLGQCIDPADHNHCTGKGGVPQHPAQAWPTSHAQSVWKECESNVGVNVLPFWDETHPSGKFLRDFILGREAGFGTRALKQNGQSPEGSNFLSS